MDSKEIRELIELVSKSNFIKFELEHDGFKLRLVKTHADKAAPAVVTVPATSAAVASPHPGPAPTAAAADAAEPSAAADGLVEFNSPIVGTFYDSPNPDADAFVRPGDRVSPGQVLCIIEAMKLMNEIEAEFDGEVVEVVAVNGQPVEYGDVLFRLRPVS